jgi:predicted MFS family arabinose efflux permease
MQNSTGRLTATLALLFAINFLNFYDRVVLGAVGESVKGEWGLTDAQLASLTTAFVLLYALVGLPLGRWADTGRRKVILAAGVIVWTLFTGLSGAAASFAWLFVFRLGVGVGEASCAPAANSLLGDLFPPQKRGRAISVFMLGLPLGQAASLLFSGVVARHFGWREAFYVAAAPGLILGLLALRLPEPPRGGAEQELPAAERPSGSAVLAVLRIPTMWWIIASGAILNLNLYALGSFLTSYLIRFHGLDIDHANRFSSVVYGLGGGVGMILGGWLADLVAGKRTSGRLELAAVAMLLSAPLLWSALEQPRGQPWRFAALMLPGCMLLHVYFSAVYSTIQDVVEPARRGTAMAVYFFVFYLFTALGLYLFGWLSDRLAAAALANGATAAEAKAVGLRGAFYVVPLLSAALAPVLWAGSRAVTRDHARLTERLRGARGAG